MNVSLSSRYLFDYLFLFLLLLLFILAVLSYWDFMSVSLPTFGL